MEDLIKMSERAEKDLEHNSPATQGHTKPSNQTPRRGQMRFFLMETDMIRLQPRNLYEH